MKFPGVVAVLCVVPSGLVLHIEITSCTFPPWTEMAMYVCIETGDKIVLPIYISESVTKEVFQYPRKLHTDFAL